MNIQEAAKKAQKTGTMMRRAGWPSRSSSVLPSNSTQGCLLVPSIGNRVGFRWQPTMDDLTASDWEVAEKETGMLKGSKALDYGDEGGESSEPTGESYGSPGGCTTAKVLEPDGE